MGEETKETTETTEKVVSSPDVDEKREALRTEGDVVEEKTTKTTVESD